MSLLISFEENHSDAQSFVIKKLQELGLVVLKDPENEHNIQVNAPDTSILEREAERLCILKHNKEGLLQEFEIEIKKKFIPYNKKSGYLFSPSQSNFLLLSFIENVTTDKVFVEKFQPGGQEVLSLFFLSSCVVIR